MSSTGPHWGRGDAMKARETISRGGFSPEDVALLDGVLLAAVA